MIYLLLVLKHYPRKKLPDCAAVECVLYGQCQFIQAQRGSVYPSVITIGFTGQADRGKVCRAIQVTWKYAQYSHCARKCCIHLLCKHEGMPTENTRLYHTVSLLPHISLLKQTHILSTGGRQLCTDPGQIPHTRHYLINIKL